MTHQARDIQTADTVMKAQQTQKEQMLKQIHIRHTYRTSLKLSSLHNQSSPTFALLHATLQQNDCTSSSFLRNSVTLTEGHSHSNWDHTVEFSCVVHPTEFERSVLTQTTVKGIPHTVFFFEYQSCTMNLAWASTSQQIVPTYRISSKSIENLWEYGLRSFWFLMQQWP